MKQAVSRIVPMEEIEEELEATLLFSGKDSGRLTCRNQVLLIAIGTVKRMVSVRFSALPLPLEDDLEEKIRVILLVFTMKMEILLESTSNKLLVEDFIDLDHPTHVYRLKKALYGLKQAPQAWYDTLSRFLLDNKFLKASPTKKHLEALKRVFQYLRGTINWGLWYLKDTAMALTAYADADHASCQDTQRSTSGSSQFLRDKLVSWLMVVV
ncbi:copia protein [Tanacetum coccineum]